MIQSTQHKSEIIAFSGGLDTTSPPLSIPPGFVRNAQNYEEDINGGYVTITGYERFDGHPAPSNAAYGLLTYTVAGTVAVGDTVTGATSSATGYVIAITASAFILTKITGIWVTETTTVGGASVTGPVVLNGASGLLGAQYKNLAADVYRADIAAVPGSGNILGVWYYKGIVYAFRNNAGGTAVDMYKPTASGWSLINLGIEVYFSAASGAEPAEGASIVQGGVSATLKRLVIESGTFAAGTAAGRLIFASVTAGPFIAGAFTAGIAATCVSQAAITIPNIGGRFEFHNANFGGAVDQLRMYGADGANRAFEFDGTTFVPINMNPPTLHPTHVVEHQQHLFLSVFSSVFNSAIGDPYNWTALGGSAEKQLSDPVTGFMQQPGSETTPALAVYSRNHTAILYGTSAATWQWVMFSDQAGAIPYSVQKVGQTFVMDDRGITTLSTSQNFGNFAEATISKRVKTWLSTRRVKVCDSHTVKDKQQYRIFFNDGSAAYWVIDNKKASMMPILLPNPVLVSCSQETYGGGDELIYFGSSNGMVYQMEKGTSFDGAAIEAYIDLVFNNSRSFQVLKRYRRLTFEMFGYGYTEFFTAYDLNYLDIEYAQPDAVSHTANLAPANWDSFTWDNFVWDGVDLTPLSMAIDGIGGNISIKIRSNSDYFTPVRFSGALLQFSPLRALR
ncbi:MAG: hypothetical protein WC856_07725 [Methylococcaceae bacterium]|jgi:hypothetical protein